MSEIVTPSAVHWDDRGIDPDGSFAEIEILLLSPSGSGGQGPENRFQSRNHRNSRPFSGIATNIKDPAKTGNTRRSKGRGNGNNLSWELRFEAEAGRSSPDFSVCQLYFFNFINRISLLWGGNGNNLSRKLRFEPG